MLRISVVAAVAATAVEAFAPSPALPSSVQLRGAKSSVQMQMDRRDVLKGAALAALGAPAAAFAASGESPKQAYFGAAPMSAPFGETYGQAGPGLWEKLNDKEREIYSRIATETKDKLATVSGFITDNSWDAARSSLRMELYETRKSMLRFTDEAGSADAKSLYGKFKKQIESLDLALIKKDEYNSQRSLSAAESTYAAWLKTVGL